ncbi:hypothetical protein C4D60_Mb04t11510 [Musa balbisiana]|uniref:Plant heme peroxidase family profile domain-containing protein n=1 Tax=Musa balbisiana TaxID=52838 RepID=A0A4S8KB97_MUSBA|nr:hypothetical protein C4D60_Mb04t11510 [Musa balbisiana]
MSCEAHLTPKYYANSCPQALYTIRTAVRSAIARERRMAASIIRLHFHDCFVQVKNACPSSAAVGNNTLAPLDLVTPNSFDNNYYKNLLTNKGLLHSDQVLFNGGPTDDIVRLYSKDQAAFLSDFADAMVKMGDISPLIGSAGEVRKICSATN